MNIAVILAGGSGRRFARTADTVNALPKQFLELGGKTVIEHSIDTFCQHPAIDEVAVVVHPDYRNVMQAIADRRKWAKMKRIIDGGAERYMSSLNAIRAYEDCDPNTNLLIHDAARPFVSADIISRVVDALEGNEAVGVGIPSTDTIWEVRTRKGGERSVERIPDRSLMWRAQTPQAFSLYILRKAYSYAIKDPCLDSTDDCGVLTYYLGESIALVEGSERNFKITTPDDLRRAEQLINEE